jgi:CO/xanthine dehydrogenase Mo-binding subunit
VLGPDTHLVETLEAIERDYMDYAHKGKDIGVGVACGYKNVGLGLGEHDYANAEIEILSTGRVLLRVGAIDLGQGACTVLAQIAAHELGIDYAVLDVETGDTDRDPDARETNASRQTMMSGNAVLDAVKNLREVVKEAARRIYGVHGKLVGKGNYVTCSSGDKIDVFELAREASRRGERIMAQGTYVAPKTFPIGSPEGKRNYVTFGFFSNLAVVKVDTSAGRVSVKKLISAYDVGRAINRLAVEGQLEGGAIMGIGYALSEEYRAHGPKRTTTLAQCGVPRIDSLPDDLVVRLIEKEDSLGPYGAKGVGEMAMVAVAPAITNAIRDATGMRVYGIPATPARLNEQRKKHEDTNS